MVSDEAADYNRAHYDDVTVAWSLILGDNLHYGAFSAETATLVEGTDRLIFELAKFGRIRKGARVLDVGCGIGGPAFVLHESFGCEVTGITTSERGVRIASKEAEARGVTESVVFVQADASANGLRSRSFDAVWQMESSHLMHDKMAVFRENFRVLKKGGALALCDLFLKKDFSVSDIYAYRSELCVLERSFGKVKMATMSHYRDCVDAAGFASIELRDISEEVTPTLSFWKRNVYGNRKEIERLLGAQAVKDFLDSCGVLQRFFDKSILGYGFICAQKE